MLTNTTVVLSHNYTLEASFRSSALQSTQAKSLGYQHVGQANDQAGEEQER